MPYDYEDTETMALYRYYSARETFWNNLALDFLLAGNLRGYEICKGISELFHSLKVADIPF